MKEGLAAAERTVWSERESVDRPARGVGVVQYIPGRAKSRAIGDCISLVAFRDVLPSAQLVKRAERFLFAIVHRARPESAFAINFAIVEAIVGNVRLGIVDKAEVQHIACDLN